MQLVEAGGQEAARTRRQLQQVLESELFTRADQLSRFLQFVVERHLAGRDDELKESVIGVEVFGRKPDYNPKYDPIVRTEARRLRTRLIDYYSNGGKGDLLIIELPKGGYSPAFREVTAESRALSTRIPSAHPKPRGPWRAAGACLSIALVV